MNPVHVSVMPQEVIACLVPDKDRAVIVDGTLGEGGHSRLFLQNYPQAKVVGMDADSVMANHAKKRIGADYGERFECRVGWNDELLAAWEGSAVDIVLLDLGLSTRHFFEMERGFSFSRAEPLDMRFNPAEGKSAADLVNTLSAKDLADIIYKYGEERFSRTIARQIAERRRMSRITDSLDLANIVSLAVPLAVRHGRIHPATRTFMALRIAVNRELERLERLLNIVPDMLAPGGKFGVISFHSLEDRMVKQAFRKRNRRYGGEFEVVTKKPFVPSAEECAANPSARSAKFRVLAKPQEGE
ncbi:MAG: 16S rRNA (cytosine(1402)-N(4))-methyltransferase [Spirochaeta sp. LUC14_002_19_P3]|nr:MAG: 16S rRNA (cytosine(1402)-N(4))-methyltransferase [Spirochaeta sp. LUC14_002_19_P3]